MSEETTGEMSEEQQQGIFAEASSASVKGEAFPVADKETPAPAPEAPAPEATPAAPVVETPAPTPTPPPVQIPTPTPEPTPKATEPNTPVIDEAATALSDMEFDDPASGEGAKITAASLEKEYPSMTGYTRALVQKALEIQAQTFEKKLAQALNSDPTIARIRQQEVEDQTASLLESVSQGDDGISNSAEIQKAALKANWVASQPQHIQDMALRSNDPRDVRYVLERAAADLKIEIKHGASAPAARAKPANNQRIALQSTLRGTGRQAPASRSDNPQTAEEAEALFNSSVTALREGKPLA